LSLIILKITQPVTEYKFIVWLMTKFNLHFLTHNPVSETIQRPTCSLLNVA